MVFTSDGCTVDITGGATFPAQKSERSHGQWRSERAQRARVIRRLIGSRTEMEGPRPPPPARSDGAVSAPAVRVLAKRAHRVTRDRLERAREEIPATETQISVDRARMANDWRRRDTHPFFAAAFSA